MKATLTFDLPDEKEEFDYAHNGVRYSLVLSDLDNYFRNKIRYDEKVSEEDVTLYEHIREKLHEFADMRGIEI